MLTRIRWSPPQRLSEEGERIVASLNAYLLSLEGKGSLAIDEASIRAANGIVFPATQNASTDANTLDDYKESDSWTPSISFATPGDVSVTYSRQIGDYTKTGRDTRLGFSIITSAFTHTTAAGALVISGVPFTAKNIANAQWVGKLQFGGITKAGYTDFSTRILANGNSLVVVASGSGVAPALVDAADMPTGGSVVLVGELTFPASA